MATLTKNLFWGRGSGDHSLDVVEGHWPTDMSGGVYIVGPDKQAPGGHWFSEQGLLCRIDTSLASDGTVPVSFRRIRTPLSKIREKFPWMFKMLLFMELSPFGASNLANTNVAHLNGRMFIGYDGGRPIEVDPDTLEYLSPVGANGEWLQAGPGILEPAISVAAHPGVDHETNEIFFVNYSPLPVGREVHIAKWDTHGEVQRWKVDGIGDFDSIHDIKVSRDHLVFADLPFVIEKETFTGGPQPRPNKDTTSLWIVDRADLASTPPGGTVTCRELIIPMPTGHLTVDYDNPDGQLRVFLEHIPIQDLMIMLDRDSRSQTTGELIDPNYEGLVTLAVQPGVIGRYVIDAAAGEIVESDLAHDPRFWGAVLGTKDESTTTARSRQGNFWFSSLGFDPDLVPTQWWDLYADAGLHHLVDPHELPDTAVPASMARFDRESMKVEELFAFEPGQFAHPPTFVPRDGATDPDDGYIVAMIHQDGAKEVWVFDAAHLDAGPLARATTPLFNPPLMLHSVHMADTPGRRRSTYRVPLWKDLLNGITGMPGHVLRLIRMGPELAQAARKD